MKIGVYFTAGKDDGGVYQYSLTFLPIKQLDIF